MKEAVSEISFLLQNSKRSKPDGYEYTEVIIRYFCRGARIFYLGGNRINKDQKMVLIEVHNIQMS